MLNYKRKLLKLQPLVNYTLLKKCFYEKISLAVCIIHLTLYLHKEYIYYNILNLIASI